MVYAIIKFYLFFGYGRDYDIIVFMGKSFDEVMEMVEKEANRDRYFGYEILKIGEGVPEIEDE